MHGQGIGSVQYCSHPSLIHRVLVDVGRIDATVGGPLVTAPTRKGFGTRVMERMIRHQLKGTVEFDWHAEGLACEIVLPRQ
jgi:two-component sensor histidine kinase